MAEHNRRQAWQFGVITCTPGVCGGDPCVAGTRLRVADLAWLTWEQAREHFPASGLVEADHAVCVAWVAGSVRYDLLTLADRLAALAGQLREACSDGDTTAMTGLLGTLRALVAAPIAGIGGATDGR